MTSIWHRIFGKTNDASAGGPALALSPYVREYMKALDRTERLGLPAPPRILVAKKCVDMDRAFPILQRCLGRYRRQEAENQAFAINVELLPILSNELGVPFVLTVGWFSISGKATYQHGDDLLQRLLRDGVSPFFGKGIPLHAWLTSPACEVLDVTLPTTIAGWTGNPELVGRIAYFPNPTPAPQIAYHPTVLGVEFLTAIGAAVMLAAPR